MRQWLVDPKILCRKHLLGEHVELHMLVGSLNKNRSVDGFIHDGLLDLTKIESRHNELIAEMKSRGYNHKSPLPKFIVKRSNTGKVDVDNNVKELFNRCSECRIRIKMLSKEKIR